ncbi:MAG TPA: hypothetical protein VLQ80_25905 [Candidatus Saccharimonadia bacterium]|nr:hypothetical protein [Candidatus Saccharimonadia bacterium]
MWRGWAQAHPADLEVFLEAVWLEEIGKLEGAHVAALRLDFPLEISDDGAQVLEGVTCAQYFVPHAFAVKGQAQGLARQLAVKLMGLLDRGRVYRRSF